MLLGLATIVSVIYLFSETGVEGGGGDGEDRVDQAVAFRACKDAVESRLTAPASAVFRDFWEDDGEVQVTVHGGGSYTIRSSVDSENGFGSLQRNDFICRVRDTGGDSWRVDSVTFG